MNGYYKMINCNTSRNNFLYLLFKAFLPLLIGGTIYIIFRTDSLLMFKWIEQMDLKGTVMSVRDIAGLYNTENIKIVIHTLPGGLWVYSYITFLLLIWGNEINCNNILYFILIPAAAVLSEFLQLAGIIRGTFDILDIVFYFTGMIFPFLIHFKKIKFKTK